MDCNSYSYAPTILDGPPPLEAYENDDMSAELETWAGGYNVTAYSYDGTLDVYEYFRSIDAARSLYEHIRENYADTPPDKPHLNKAIRDAHKIDRRRTA